MSAAEPGAPRAFERQATGLVREAAWWDVLIYNVNFISIGLMAAFLFNTTIPFYPGVNVYLNELVAFAIVIPLSLVFAMFAAAMPRSGGDYVYVSRTLHPALGMMSSWNNTVCGSSTAASRRRSSPATAWGRSCGRSATCPARGR
jgi:basic amino acid/polyamine antiporter, APA family